jgi:hypothetical protein
MEKSTEALLDELYAGVERFLSPEYRAIAKSLGGMMLNASWPDAVDFVAGIAKEYGRSGDGRGYKQARDVIDAVLGKAIAYEPDKRPPLPRD